ncbi:MAG TPA: FKBP-type peptidyl-prolyl cis-trans isomerase [Thermoanaerobaculia bacterium]|jgi:peptidylprolyl isomerase|nr:FKBP-type peptidyl-prolyl cis-trans isomerase [Thermoanaerobaculia bacterium]
MTRTSIALPAFALLFSCCAAQASAAAAKPAASTPPATGGPAVPTAIPAPPDVAAPPADAQRTASGLASKVITPGTGKEHPSAAAQVKVHYTGWTPDGKMFDSSVPGGKPVMFPLNRVIAGFSEGIQLMVEGEKRRLWIPGALAYDNSSRPDAPKGMLVFDIELLGITEPPTAPPDVAAVPADAEKTASGLASKVLKPGTGTVHPKATSTVQVHYSGWTTDGKMFDSSVVRGNPVAFPLTNVVPGWTEGLQLMVEGEKRRFWIPSKLAYDGQPGYPQGMLVFDIELLKIVR